MYCRSTKTQSCLLLLILAIAGCSSSRYGMQQDRPPAQDVNAQKVADAVPRKEPRSKYGNPESYVVMGKRYHVMKTCNGFRQRGTASWYGQKFHGHRTSSGEPYNMYAMTAAHKTLPLPSYVRVTNVDNHKSVIVRVNDRGPFHDNRIIDLSYVAAKKLGITANGTGRVEITYLDPAAQTPQHRVSALKNKSADTPANAKDRTPRDKAEQRLFLQLGAFSERSNAEQLRERIVQLIDNGSINTGYNVESKLYRVRIGPLASLEEADKLANKISRSGFSKPRIVTD